MKNHMIMYIAIWCTYPTLIFDIVSTIVEALVTALHHFLYPIIVEKDAACDAKQVVTASLTSDTILCRSDREIWGKYRESGVMVNRLVPLIFSSTARTKSSFTTNGRPLRWSPCVFIKQSLPSPYHSTTHGMFSIHVTKSTMNFNRFHVLRIQETDYTPHFTCGGILCFLKHLYKHTARCVNTVRISANSARALPQNQQTLHACAPSWPQRYNGNIRKRNLFSG